ncbi:eEF1-gamma domain-containing protein [Xylariomycetidae sp. FL0641]|nr:eEF1-gamma domain-containing protein [Xylariomycetidae sp. FL0641]
MAFGKIFTREANPRTTAILAVAKANGLDLETVNVDTTNPSPEFLKANKLAKVPTYVGTDGYVLTECMAIAIYITSQNEKTTLLGKTKQDYASILKWMSFFNTEVLPKLGAWYRPLLGWDPYNKKSVEEASKGAEKAVSVVEEHLLHNTYLVGERVTLADLFAVSIISRGFEFFYDKKWRAANPCVTRWYETVYNQPIFSTVAKPFELLDAPKLTNTPPKKPEQAKAASKAAPKAAPKAAAPAPAAEEPAPAPKPKHPCELLPKSEWNLEDFKRYFSNHEEDDSMKHFWETCPWTDYSIWKCQFKYNDELTLTFMSNNLIGGFNTRLEGSRKYVFGCASVYGENNDSVIEGAFVIRGDDYKAVFDVAPDYESYEFTKLDPNNPEDRAFVESMWKWDKPVVHNGKEYQHADGRVFK